MALKIYLKTPSTGTRNVLPYATDMSTPTLGWDLPSGFSQIAYCLELKTQTKVNRSDGSYGYAYYSSARQESTECEHTVALEMIQSVWAGVVEVRLRLYSSTAIYSTHDSFELSEDEEYPYDFEGENPQYYYWDSNYDGYYLLMDPLLESVAGTYTPTFAWSNSSDEDETQTLSYQLEYSRTPLFETGYYGQSLATESAKYPDALLDSLTYGEYQCYYVDSIPFNTGIFSQSSPTISLKALLFYRVRAWDGLDYGEWSTVNAYFNNPSYPPNAWFVSVISNCSSTDSNAVSRPNGEVSITIHLEDLDSEILSAYLTYRLSTETATARTFCSLDSSTVALPANQDVTVTWQSARQLPNENVIVYLYLYAFDGTMQSSEVIWSGTVTVNNTGIGFGYGDSSDDVISYRFKGKIGTLEKWILIPEEKAVASLNSDTGELEYLPGDIPSGTSDDDGDYYYYQWYNWWEWIGRLGEDIANWKFQPGEGLVFNCDSLVKRSKYNMYMGYDNSGTYDDEAGAYLEYEEEFNAREKDPNEREVRFCNYFLPSGSAYLGRGGKDVTFFLKLADYNRFRIRRPRIVRSGPLGLYNDGMAIDNSANSLFTGETSKDEGISTLLKQTLWKNFYQLDAIYQPEVEATKLFLGEYEQSARRYSNYDDDGDSLYWSLFEYQVVMNLPIAIEAEVNDRFVYNLNGIAYSGSLLDDTTEKLYLSHTGTMSTTLRSVLEKLFPTSIFQTFYDSDLVVNGSHYTLRIYSLRNSRNQTFQFCPTDCSCYSLFGIDTNRRYCSAIRATSTSSGYVIWSPPSGKANSHTVYSEATPVYEVEMDAETCLGEGGEINSTEPLFTCDPIHVNQYGCHYKYTPERYRIAGKLWIRRYWVRPVYPTASSEPIRDLQAGETTAPAMGYRNYRLSYAGKNALGEDLYTKVPIPGRIGGVPPVKQLIPVVFEGNFLEEYGWWPPETDLEKADPQACLSHTWVNGTNGESGVYYRKEPGEYLIKYLACIDCYCTEYVPVEPGWEKPFWGQALGPVNRIPPVAFRGSNPWGYKWYVQGAYQVPATQEEIPTESDNAFHYTVETTSDDTASSSSDITRFSTEWKEIYQDTSSENLGISVDPGYCVVRSKEGTIEKNGYQPDLTLEDYFREDTAGDWAGQIIPTANSYVHHIHTDNDISFPYKARVYMFRKLLASTQTIELPESEGTKAPYLDYRFIGRNQTEMYYYYSALPQSESPAYATRPPEIYGEDRPTRIRGFIDSMSVLIPWKFLYLQTGWNTYNLIHWEGNQDENIYAKLEVALVDEFGATGSYQTLKTKNAEWFEKFSCYLIPFEKLKQSDYVDTLNGTYYTITNGFKEPHNFIDGQQYRFRICGVNINSGATNTEVLSTVFEYSLEAYSPPIITNVTYEKWKREFTIEFRFDDHMGRKYDLINFYYATYGQNEASPAEADFIELGTDFLSGELEDLASNLDADNVISDAYLIKHQVFCSGDVLENLTGNQIRFRLEAIPAEDREGLTEPVFRFLMWGNEFLQQADADIASVIGSKNRWVYRVGGDEEGNPVEGWEYLAAEDAVIVPGILTEQQAIIDEIEDSFEAWYLTVAKFQYAGFEAIWHYLQLQSRDELLYEAVFEGFLEFRGLEEEFDDYVVAKNRTRKYCMTRFISDRYASEFNWWWENRACLYVNESLLEGFEVWFEDNRILSRAEGKVLYLQQPGQVASYEQWLVSNSSDYPEDDNEARTAYLVEKGLQVDFETYYATLNNYPDNRYDDRLEYVQTYYSEAYQAWLQNPLDGYGVALDPEYLEKYQFNEDEMLRRFIVSDPVIYNGLSYTNAGKTQARTYYLSVAVNGVTYSQQIQTATAKITAAQATLNEAYATRNKYETLHRRRLIAKGYFSNGWKNNQVYVEGGGMNEPFRFRVENQPVTGSRTKEVTSVSYDGTWPDSVAPLAGYDTRWDIYFHFQMDFYDSFDSQSGQPLRDYYWQRLDCSGYAGSEVDLLEVEGVQYIRIMGGIEAETGAYVLPNNLYTPDSGEYGQTPTTADPYSFQFAGRFSILKSELPGELAGDILPENWNTGSSASEQFNQVYYWRVAPYNLVRRPVWEREWARLESINFHATIEGVDFWEVVVKNNFRGDRKYARMASTVSYWSYCPYVWVATQKLDTSIWKLDYESTSFNSLEPYYENFFPGTDKDKGDIDDYSQNPLRSSYRERLQQGEVVFLTDRPRELVSGELSYIEDENNHFRSLWIPFNVNRRKPWVVFDEGEGCWLMVTHKDSKNRSGYTEMVFTLSRGLSPQTFGEECQLFPTSTQEAVSTVIEGAESLGNPCLIRVEGQWLIYFNVRKTDLAGEVVYESWRAESSNLYDWDNFTQLKFIYTSSVGAGKSVMDMAVYVVADAGKVYYTLYGVQDTSLTRGAIRQFSSEDGLSFTLEKTLYQDIYSLHRPTQSNGRIYFGMVNGTRGKVVSIPLAGEGDTPVVTVEKGTDCDLSDTALWSEEDKYFTPLVLEDYVQGTPVERMYYLRYAKVYAYTGVEWGELDQGLFQELAIFTEYREEYSWERSFLNEDETEIFNYRNSTIASTGEAIMRNGSGEKVDLQGDSSPAYIDTGELTVLVRSSQEPLAVKFPFYLDSEYVDTESEGEFLDFYNVGDTEAVLTPETVDSEYQLSEYTTEKYLSENLLEGLFEQWLKENYPAPVSDQYESYRTEFLLSCKQYSLYLKWSRKGPGIYRYLNSVKKTSYTGDGE